jgi:hypothetical protein
MKKTDHATALDQAKNVATTRNPSAVSPLWVGGRASNLPPDRPPEDERRDAGPGCRRLMARRAPAGARMLLDQHQGPRGGHLRARVGSLRQQPSSDGHRAWDPWRVHRETAEVYALREPTEWLLDCRRRHRA